MLISSYLAGILFPPYSVTCDGFESQFAVNYLNHCLLTHLLMPQLAAAGEKKSSTGAQQKSRIVNVSSSLHSIGWLQIDDLQSKYSTKILPGNEIYNKISV